MINIDLNILDGDIEFDALAMPSQVNDAKVISQDIKHRLIESGKLTELIGLRNKDIIKKILTEIELIVEQDNRLIPGSIKVFSERNGQISVTAKTRKEGVV